MKLYLASTKEDGNVSQTSEEDNIAIPTQHEPAPKKLKRDPKLQLLKEAFGILQAAANRLPLPQSADDNPELRLFLDFILAKMKNYSTQTRNLIQGDIFQIIFRADQGFYDDPRQYGYFSGAPSTSTGTTNCYPQTHAPSLCSSFGNATWSPSHVVSCHHM
ncbi:uncharacterized protein LOC111869341 [Cryptotermes secundus]|uniref:uncharacterized protein LOC111869341 n=1 Tax=Cryptotermes secundus TaxID=105785 RepID=UPI000CD7CD69|nr:uncharacterized protein LOC111869341 [Cryptotermes secundus]